MGSYLLPVLKDAFGILPVVDTEAGEGSSEKIVEKIVG